jgi:hypothetical protein
MKTICNPKFAGRTVQTPFGIVKYDAEGKVEVTEEYADILLQREGFLLVGEESDQKLSENNETTDDEEVVTTDEENSEDNQESDSEDDESDEETSDVGGTLENITEEELKAMNVMSLKKMAKDAGIDVSHLTKKDQLIDAILQQ